MTRLRVGDVLAGHDGARPLVVIAKRWHPIARRIECFCNPLHYWQMSDCVQCIWTHSPAAVIGRDLGFVAKIWRCRAKFYARRAIRSKVANVKAIWRKHERRAIGRARMIDSILRSNRNDNNPTTSAAEN